MVIRRFEPLSCAKIVGTIYAVLGIVFGAMFSLVSLFGAFAGGDRSSPFIALFGVGAVIVLPIFYGMLGFVSALIGAWLYNALAGALGGIEMDIQ